MSESVTTIQTWPSNGMPMCDPPLVFHEPPEYPPEGRVVYIPHRWRNGSKAPIEMFKNIGVDPALSDSMGCAFTIRREGNKDTFIPCGCKLCYEKWAYWRKRA